MTSQQTSATTPTYAQFIRAFCANNGIALHKLDRGMARADYKRLYPQTVTNHSQHNPAQS